MKRLFSFFFAALLLTSSVSAQNAGIQGKISGLAGNTIYYICSEISGLNTPVDFNQLTSLTFDGESFYFNVTPKGASVVRIIPGANLGSSDDGSLIPYESEMIILFVNPGETVAVDASMKGNIVKYVATGNVANDTYTQIQEFLFPFYERRVSGEAKLKVAQGDSQVMEARKEIAMSNAAVKTMKGSFISQYPDSPLSAYFQKTLEEQPAAAANASVETAPSVAATATAEKTSTAAANGTVTDAEKAVTAATETVASAEKTATAAATEPVAAAAAVPKPEWKLPDFTATTLKGEEFTLSSLSGQYILLDFWATWCPYCIQSFPDLVKAADKYKGKVTVVTVCINSKDDNWRSVVEKYGLGDLINVLSADGAIATSYGVKSIPAKFLITPDGERKFVGSFDALDVYVK